MRDESYEDAMKSLPESRNLDAHHSPLTEEINRAAEIMDSKGNLKSCVYELIAMWKPLCTSNEVRLSYVLESNLLSL